MQTEIIEIDTEDRALTRADAGKTAGAGVQRVRLPLKTPDQCAVEAAKVYRLARTGQIPLAEATRLVFMLTSISRMLTDSMDLDFAARLEALETERRA